MRADEHDIDGLLQKHERLANEVQGAADWSFNAFDDFLHVIRELCWLGGIALVVLCAIALGFALGDLGRVLP